MTARTSIGVAVRDITPAWPVMLAGFGQRVSPSEGVLDPIFAKALWLDAGDTRLAFITTDLLCVPGSLAEWVARAAGERLGLLPAEICLTASHTHSAPPPHDAGDGAPGVTAFVAHLKDVLVDLLADARADARPARVSAAVGAADLFFNRRTRGRPNHVDPRLPVISVAVSYTHLRSPSPRRRVYLDTAQQSFRLVLPAGPGAGERRHLALCGAGARREPRRAPAHLHLHRLARPLPGGRPRCV